MNNAGGSILLGAILGVLFVIGVIVIGFDVGAEKVKTASLPISPPILFQPK